MSEDQLAQSSVVWSEGLQFVGRGGRSNSTFVLDGAPEVGGGGAGVRPSEALLLALAGCTGMDVISILQKKRQRVTAFRVNVRGVQADEHPKRYVRIELEYVVRGWNISEEAVARSIELSRTKYCIVSATLNAEIVHTVRIEQESVPGDR